MTKRGKSYGDYGDASEAGTTAVAPPEVTDAPYVEQRGNSLNCTLGNWTNEPTSRTYQWMIDDVVVGEDAENYAIQPEDVGKSARCVQTATNDMGSAESTSNTVVIAALQGVPVDMDEPKTYKVLEETVVDDPENPGSTITHAKDAEVQLSINQARKIIDAGGRIVGID